MLNPARFHNYQKCKIRRLTCEDGALGDLGPQVEVLLRVLQEVDELHDLDLGLLAAGNVLERHLKRRKRKEEGILEIRKQFKVHRQWLSPASLFMVK